MRAAGRWLRTARRGVTVALALGLAALASPRPGLGQAARDDAQAGPRALFPPGLAPVPGPLPPTPPRVTTPRQPSQPSSTGAARGLEPAPGVSGPQIVGPRVPPAAGPDEQGQGDGRIVQRALAPPSPWRVSGLGAGDRLARDPWGPAGSELDRRVIDGVVAALAPAAGAAAPTDLAERVLLAPPPATAADAASMVARLQRLVAIGRPESAARLADLLPAAARAAIGREVFEALLAGGRADSACGDLQSLGDADAYAASARLVCAVAQGDAPRAQVLVEVLRERGAPYAPAVEALALIALRGEAGAGGLAGALAELEPGLQPLGLAALRWAPVAAATKLARLPPLAAAMLARNAGLAAETRAALAEAAYGAGLLDAAGLRAALPGSQADGRGRALQRLAAARSREERAAALLAAWPLGGSGLTRVGWAVALAPGLRGLEPVARTLDLPVTGATTPGTAARAAARTAPGANADQLDLAAAAVPILAVAGDWPRLRPWTALAGGEASLVRARLLPFLAAAGALPPTRLAATDLGPRERAILAGLPGFGSEPSSAAADPILAALQGIAPAAPVPAGADPMQRFRLGLAAAEQRAAPAAVAVLALAALGDGQAASDVQLRESMAALGRAGLGSEARQIAAALLLAAAAPAGPAGQSDLPAPTAPARPKAAGTGP